MIESRFFDNYLLKLIEISVILIDDFISIF